MMPQHAIAGAQPQPHKTKYQKREPAGEREALQLLELSEKRKRALEAAKEAHLLAVAEAEERLQQTLLAKLEAIEAAKRQAVARHAHREERRAAYMQRRQQSATEIQAVWRGRKGRAIAARRRAAGKYIIKWVRNKKQLKVFFRAAKCAAVLRLASGVGAWVQTLVHETRQQLLMLAVARQFRVQRAMNGIKAFLSERARYWRCRRLIAVMRIVHFLRKNTRRRRLNRNRKLRGNRRRPAPQRRRSSSPLEINPAAQLVALSRARGTMLSAQQKAHAQGSPTSSGSALHSAASTGNVLGKLSRQGSVSSATSAHSTAGPGHSHGSAGTTTAAGNAAKLGTQLDGYSTPRECSDEFVSRARSNPVMFTASSGGFDLNIEGRPVSRDQQQSARRQQFEAELVQRRLLFMNKKQQQIQQTQQQTQQQQQQQHVDGFSERARSSTDAVVAADQLASEATASRSVVQLGKLPDSRLEEARAFARKKAEQDAAAKQKADTEAALHAAAKAESDAARAAHDERVRRERHAAIDRMRARKKTEAEAQQRATDEATAVRKAELAAKATKMQEALKAKAAAAAAATAAAAAAAAASNAAAATAKSSSTAKGQQQAALIRGSTANLSRTESVKDSVNGLLPQLLSNAVVHRAPSSQALLETLDAHTTTGQRRVSRLRASSSSSSSGSGIRPRSSANSDKASATATAPALHSSSKSVGDLRKSSSAGPTVAATKGHLPHADRNTSTGSNGKSSTSSSNGKHVASSTATKQLQQQPPQQQQQKTTLKFLSRAQTGLKDRYDTPSKPVPLPRSSLPSSTSASAAQKAAAAKAAATAAEAASSSSTVHTKQTLTALQHGTTVDNAVPIASSSNSSDAVDINTTTVDSAVVFVDDFLDVDDDTVAAFW
jgi:trimeric autotransporter adhesin